MQRELFIPSCQYIIIHLQMYPYRMKGHYFLKEGEYVCLNLDPRVSLTGSRKT